MKKLIVAFSLILCAFFTLNAETAHAAPPNWKITISIPIPHFHTGRSGCHSGFSMCYPSSASVTNNTLPSISGNNASIIGHVFADQNNNTFVTWTFPGEFLSDPNFSGSDLSAFDVDNTMATFFTDPNNVTYTMVSGSYTVTTDENGNLTVTIPVTSN